MVVLLVLFVIISFLTVDYFVVRGTRGRAVLATSAAGSSHPSVAVATAASMSPDRVPGDVFVAPGHVWLRPDRSGAIRLGADGILMALLGGLDSMYLLPEGTKLQRGGPLMMLRRGGRALKVRSPVDGVVKQVNHQARAAPRGVPADPFEKGWIYSIAPKRLSTALEGMVGGADARQWMGTELQRLKDLLLQGRVGEPVVGAATLADGGALVERLDEHLGDQEWEDLIGRFFGAPGGKHDNVVEFHRD